MIKKIKTIMKYTYKNNTNSKRIIVTLKETRNEEVEILNYKAKDMKEIYTAADAFEYLVATDTHIKNLIKNLKKDGLSLEDIDIKKIALDRYDDLRDALGLASNTIFQSFYSMFFYPNCSDEDILERVSKVMNEIKDFTTGVIDGVKEKEKVLIIGLDAGDVEKVHPEIQKVAGVLLGNRIMRGGVK